MLIVGAKGFAKDVLQNLKEQRYLSPIAFYDDVSEPKEDNLYDQFPILHSEKEVRSWFHRCGNDFTLGVGNPNVRKTLYNKFTGFGGKLTSTISPRVNIGYFDVTIKEGTNLMIGSTIVNSVFIDKGALINLHCTIGHDCTIGEFVELSPGVHISGNCCIEEGVSIGTNATVLPGLTIGKNSIIGAGSVVTKNIPANCTAVGVPAKIIGMNE